MATEASKFKIGLFVTIGLAIAVVAIIVLGASKFFTDTNTYVTYFEESVQGLEPDSLVRYRGVPIGRVYKIRIAPDGALIEVVLKINTKTNIDSSMRIKIRMAGLTGMKYLEIDRKELGEIDLCPEIFFKLPHPLIPSNPSDAQEILLAIERVFEKLNHLDMQRLETKINSSLDSLQDILSDKRMKRIMTNLEDTTANWREASKRIDDMLNKPGVPDSLFHAAETLSTIKTITAQFSKQLEEMNLGSRINTSTSKFDRLMDDATLTSEEVRLVLTQQEDNIALILENLKMTTEALNILINNLKDNPAQLFFSDPPVPMR